MNTDAERIVSGQGDGVAPIEFLRMVRGDPPSLSVLQRKDLRRRFEAHKFILWVWTRALRRGRSPRGRVLATLVADSLLTAEPRDLDRAEIARQKKRWCRWDAIREGERERIGIEPESDHIWGLFERKYGKGRRVLEFSSYPPRLAKQSVMKMSRAAVGEVDTTLLRAFRVLWDEPEADNLLVAYALATERIATLDARRRLSATEPGEGVNLKRSANELLLDAVRYQVETLRKKLDRVWFCFGCDWWHTDSKGPPRRYLSSLMGMQLKAATIGGLNYGDGERVFQEVRSEAKGPVPDRSHWYRFVREHHLCRADDRRTMFVRREGTWSRIRADFGHKVD